MNLKLFCYLRVHSLVHVKNLAKKAFQKAEKSFIEPVKIYLGIDPTTNKADKNNMCQFSKLLLDFCSMKMFLAIA